MTPRWNVSLVVVSLLLPAASRSGAEPARRHVPADAVIEAVVFDGIAMPEQRAILDRIAVKAGDRLDAATRQRIGQRLNASSYADLFSYLPYVDRGLTFSDRPGSRAGSVVLVISVGC
jgi:hypothetical protein